MADKKAAKPRDSRNKSDRSPPSAVGAGATTPLSLEARIRTQYDAMPDSERKVADLILDFPGEVSAYSATELADLAGASKAAVTRLIRRLGYETFEEARRAARDAQNWGSPLYLTSREPVRGNFAARVQEHIEQDARNVSLTLEGLRADVFKDMVDAIATAKRVYFLGYRNSHQLAAYAHWQVIQVRPDVYMMPTAGNTIAEQIADLTPDDILVVIGFRRRVAEIPRAISAAAEIGAKVLYVTDWNAGTLPGARWTVPVAVRGKDLFDRYAAAMSFLHFLSVGVAERMGETGRKRLNKIESLHEDLHDFD